MCGNVRNVPLLSGNFPTELGNIRRLVFTAWRGRDASRMAIVYARGASKENGLQFTRPTFGHLAAAGVAGAKKEDFQHRWNRWLVFWMKWGMQFAYQDGGCASPHGWKPTSGSFLGIFASFGDVRYVSPN